MLKENPYLSDRLKHMQSPVFIEPSDTSLIEPGEASLLIERRDRNDKFPDDFFMIGGEQKSEIIDLDQVEDDEEQEENNNKNGGLFEFDLPLD